MPECVGVGGKYLKALPSELSIDDMEGRLCSCKGFKLFSMCVVKKRWLKITQLPLCISFLGSLLPSLALHPCSPAPK
jgi:hypothetical protein